MNADLLRYTCQMALPGFGEGAQLLLKHAKVLIVGVGGLGCPVAQYLTAAGVGTIGLADFDNVTVGNLHRQILFGPADIGENKAKVACEHLHKQNPAVLLMPYARITDENALDIIEQYDIVVDCTDNFGTRYLLNDACVLSGKPLVYGAIYQFEGQVAVWNVENSDGSRSPNYRDLYPRVNAAQIPNCTEGGVIPTLAGVIGCLQANEVLKYITNTGELLKGKVLLFDALVMQSRVIKTGTVTTTAITALQGTCATPVMTAGALKAALINNEIDLIDVRTAEERNAFDIGGKHIPLHELAENLHQINPDAKTVFYCASGKRSGDAVELVKRKMPDAELYSLEGGMKEWLDMNA
ncbi:thiamine biosynthesis protein [Mucilaginibacter hurinus]|uniref:Molybdopterin-synthase adenylyltransferase n=1 Tax=Mucilaginibacter hurinus TaxID=2201324 RepID=A0A367GTQ0_9SPHI|nr:HesA/MoeB/ThiF family protein [Mucilaginibacter hurinus]RCH56083.1 thiamine biosynthesis protein [Mucilaginibacter hurinus]